MEQPIAQMTLDVTKVRADFKILDRQVHGKPLVYFDNAATSQTPDFVVDAIADYYHRYNANIHRGVHTLSQEATEAYENARKTMAKFMGAADEREIIFTMGTTDGINLVAQTWGRQNVKAGDEIILTRLEHHSNIVPWQMLAEETGAVIRVCEINEAGEIKLDHLAELLNEKTAILAFNHVSNALGTINPAKEMIAMAHRVGAISVIDGAQSAPHIKMDMDDLGADFYALGGHKMYGPTGTGVLYGKLALLEKMPPWRGGGEMIKTVTFEKTTYNELPHKFEAGTPNICGGIALAEAAKYMQHLGVQNIAQHESDLCTYATEKLQKISGFKPYGIAKQKAGVISFLVEGTHPYDVGTLLDKLGIAVRTGHHCCQPLMDHWGIPGTIRASFAAYNTFNEVDAFVAGLERAVGMLK